MRTFAAVQHRGPHSICGVERIARVVRVNRAAAARVAEVACERRGPIHRQIGRGAVGVSDCRRSGRVAVRADHYVERARVNFLMEQLLRKVAQKMAYHCMCR